MTMKLTKGETNELLEKITNDNYTYGLIFKLIYVYAKDAKLVLSLRWSDISFKNNTIKFKDIVFPLIPSLKEELLEYKHDDMLYVFLDSNDDDLSNRVDVYRKRLRYYLANNVKNLDVCHRIRHSILSITDLRRLRGQHLIVDGVSLKLVRDLYMQYEGTTTQFKKYLDYDALINELYPCEDMDMLFKCYTDLGIFDFDRSDSASYIVSTGDFEFIISINDDGLSFVDDVPVDLKNIVSKLFDDGLLDNLGVLGVSEFKVVGGLSFIRA